MFAVCIELIIGSCSDGDGNRESFSKHGFFFGVDEGMLGIVALEPRRGVQHQSENPLFC